MLKELSCERRLEQRSAAQYSFLLRENLWSGTGRAERIYHSEDFVWFKLAMIDFPWHDTPEQSHGSYSLGIWDAGV